MPHLSLISFPAVHLGAFNRGYLQVRGLVLTLSVTELLKSRRLDESFVAYCMFFFFLSCFSHQLCCMFYSSLGEVDSAHTILEVL